jgi:NtrC-family two-component system response regulator AlgB
VREGAVDYLPKPFTPGQCLFLMDRISRDLERRAGSGEYLGRAGPPDALLSSVSPTMKRVIAEVQQLGPHEVPVLLLGENGTGKGVLAHVVHALSPRRARPFEVVRCACSSRESLAVELFGHAEGGTSGALRSSEGRIEAANGGTLFFDEVAELPANLQAWLVRFLESKTFERLGESHSRSANVRVLAASAHDLETEVKAGRFRQDLYYRLGGVDVSIPPLRERREDILPLASWFLAHFAEADRRVAPSLSAGVQKQLLAYSWPGNVRELRNSMEQAAIFSLGREEIGVDDLPYRLLSQEGAGVFLGGDFTLEQVKQEHIQRVMARAATLSEASQTLGINASTLWRRRKHSGGAD